MTFDPSIRPSVDGQAPPPPIDRYIANLFETLGVRVPGALDDLHTAARSAGHLFGNGVADALGRIVGTLGDLDASARSDLVYLRRAIDDRHAAMLTELDAAHGDAAIHRQLLDDARVELAAATVDALTRFQALQRIRRDLTDVATWAKGAVPNGADRPTVDWFAVVDQAVATIDGATANPGNGDEPAGDDMAGDLLGRWPRSHAEAGVPVDPDADSSGEQILAPWANVPEPGDTAAGS